MPNIPNIPNITNIFTKIVLRNDVIDNWKASRIILEKGEPALEMDFARMTSRMKIGDGIHTFNELPYSTITPNDIQDMIDKSVDAAGNINSIVLSPGTDNGTIKLTVNDIVYDNIPITGLGSAAYTNTSNYATAEQGDRAETAMVYKGLTNKMPVEDKTGNTFSVAEPFVIPSEKAETNFNTKVETGDTIIANTEGKWSVMPKGVADAAKTLTVGISANIVGGAKGQAVAANAGETMNIEVTELNTDFLKQGTKVIVLNGGSASS
jgi:hypothetical protein